MQTVLSHTRKPRLWGVFLLVWLIPHVYAQDDLTILPEDVYMEKTADREGIHLFIKKKPGISSVVLTESSKDPNGIEDTYSYRALEWNEINGNETRIPPPASPDIISDDDYFLMDSSPEYHPILGEVFHIYVPLIIAYGYPNTRHATLSIEDGLFINIRAFALPYIDYSGKFKDNPFTLSIIPPPVEEEPPPEPAIIPPVEEEPPPEPPPEPVVTPPPKEEPPPEPVIIPPVEEEEPPPEPEPISPPEEPPPEPPPEEESPIFAPTISVKGGVAVFFPGPEGINVGLKDNYDPIGTITVTNKFTKTWGFQMVIDRDIILMNRVLARAIWDTDFIGLEAGPYFGLLNFENGRINPGLSLVLHLRIPWWNLFSSFQWDSVPGKNLAGPGDYIQSYSEIKAGVVLPFGRLTVSMLDRSSTFQDDLGLERINHWIRYNLALEIDHPSIAWGFRLDLGYQRLYWTYRAALVPLTYMYYDIYAGLEVSYRIRSLTLFLGLEAPLYPFVYPDIQSIKQPQAPFFGQINLGFRWTLSTH